MVVEFKRPGFREYDENCKVSKYGSMVLSLECVGDDSNLAFLYWLIPLFVLGCLFVVPFTTFKIKAGRNTNMCEN
jgi:hypothetical protein